MACNELWITIVPLMPSDKAEKAFEQWKIENPEKTLLLTEDDIRKDTVCGKDESGQSIARVRYRVKTEVGT